MERERHQLLLAELQTAHHRQLLLQAHVRNLTDRIATLERQVKQYQDMIEVLSPGGYAVLVIGLVKFCMSEYASGTNQWCAC